MPIPISITNLSKSYRSSPLAKPTRAVDNVSLEIAPGELFFLLGPSGCGKTTLLRMIAGFIEPSRSPHSGSIRFASRDVTHTPPNKRNTAMVFQSYALWPHMTVAQNVAFGLNVRKVPADERDTRVRQALEAVQLAEFADRKPNQLSGGQQQRVALARALVIRPDVLLLDEPLSNLDAKLRADLRLQVREICKSAGITSVYVTHDQHEALSMADRIAIMRNGRIEQLGTPRDLYTRPRSAFVATFLGEANILPARVLAIRPPSTATNDVISTPASTSSRTIQAQPDPERPITEPSHLAISSMHVAPDDQILNVETPLGTLPAIAPSGSYSPAPGSAVRIMIRPESIDLVPIGAPRAPHGRIIRQQYLGQSRICVCSVAGHEVTVSAPPSFCPEQESVMLAVREPAIVLADGSPDARADQPAG